MKKESWLILANSSCMKLFRFPTDTRHLTDAETIHFDERHKRAHDINTDKEGRTYQSIGGQSSAYERHNDLRKIEQEEFAEVIAHKLNEAARENKLDKLYLAVSKEFYGILKTKFSLELQKKIAEHIQKDLIHEKINSIWSHFPPIKEKAA